MGLLSSPPAISSKPRRSTYIVGSLTADLDALSNSTRAIQHEPGGHVKWVTLKAMQDAGKTSKCSKCRGPVPRGTHTPVGRRAGNATRETGEGRPQTSCCGFWGGCRKGWLASVAVSTLFFEYLDASRDVQWWSGDRRYTNDRPAMPDDDRTPEVGGGACSPFFPPRL